MLSNWLLRYVRLCLHATYSTSVSHNFCVISIMKILLRYGFCHTIVLDIDKGSKFFGVCHEAIDVLQINCHILSSANHNPMVLERINRYLVKGLNIMCNERNSVRVAMEAILLLLFRGGTDKTNYYLFLVSRSFLPQPDLWSCCCLHKIIFWGVFPGF